MSEIRKTEPFSYEERGLTKDAEIIRQPPKRAGFQAALPRFSWVIPLVFLLGMTAGASLLAYFQKDRPEPAAEQVWEQQRIAAETEPESLEPMAAVVSEVEEQPWKVFPAEAQEDIAERNSSAQKESTPKSISGQTPVPKAETQTSAPARADRAKGSATPWIKHRVTPGETARVLCRKYEISLAELYRENGGKFVPKVGRDILVPALDFPQHEVKKGETLYTIAGKSGVDLQQLVQLNGIRQNRIKVGQVLRLR